MCYTAEADTRAYLLVFQSGLVGTVLGDCSVVELDFKQRPALVCCVVEAQSLCEHTRTYAHAALRSGRYGNGMLQRNEELIGFWNWYRNTF